MLSEMSQSQKGIILHGSIYKSYRVTHSKIHRSRKYKVVSRSCGERKNVELLFTGYRVSVFQDEKSSGDWLPNM